MTLTAEEREDLEDDKALQLLTSPLADRFTKALDRHGWMIVPQPDYSPGRWFLHKPSKDCPAWCDNGLSPPKKPTLRIVE
jgi:hypothetical protein